MDSDAADRRFLSLSGHGEEDPGRQENKGSFGVAGTLVLLSFVFLSCLKRIWEPLMFSNPPQALLLWFLLTTGDLNRQIWPASPAQQKPYLHL